MTVAKVGKIVPVKPSRNFTHTDEPQVHYARRKELLEKHPELAQLQKPYPLSFLYVLMICVGQHAIAVACAHFDLPFYAVFLAGFCIGAVVVHAQWVLVHDLTHDCVFESRNLNHVSHLIANLPIIFPSTMAFRHYHRLHHAYLNEAYNDPDMPGPLEAKIFGTTTIGKAVWLLFFGLIQGIRVNRYHAQADIMTFLNWAIQFTYIYYLCTAYSWQAMTYMFISSMFAIGLHPVGARWVAEHYATHEGQETYSYYGPLNYVSFAIGYHNEHHDLPRVPWAYLHKITETAPEFYNNLAEHPSYTKMLFDFIFNPNFTLETRVIHPSFQEICDHTQSQDRADVKQRKHAKKAAKAE